MEDIVRWRRELHKIPELGLKEFKTAKYLRNELTKLGYCYEVMGTATIVYIDNHKESTLAFRSDIDALAITEKNDIDYKSENDGFMHACGHDGHMAALLGLAKRLKTLEIHKYNYLLIFQPAEESKGGAKDIVESGIFDKYHVIAVFGMHLMPFLDEGIIGSKAGALMAECRELDVKIIGKSAHAGLPHESIDSIVIASEAIQNYQKIVSRKSSPFEPIVIHIGMINGGEARNSAASDVLMQGTIRVFNEDTCRFVIDEIEKVHKGLEIIYDCQIEMSCPPMYPSVINNESVYRRFIELVDNESYVELKEPLMLAEDFSFYQRKVPGLFFYLGTKSDIYNSGLHTETFNFNEEVLEKAVDLYQKIATEY